VEDGSGYCVNNATSIANSAPTTPGINHHQQHPMQQMAEGGMFAMPLANQQMTGGGQS
jgi:hypothetical protein